jgi:hypothetical protein
VAPRGCTFFFRLRSVSSQVRIDNNRRAKNIAAAIGAAGVGHVIMRSSIGAQQSRGDGTSPQMIRQLASKRMLFERLLASHRWSWAVALVAAYQHLVPS